MGRGYRKNLGKSEDDKYMHKIVKRYKKTQKLICILNFIPHIPVIKFGSLFGPLC